MTKVTASCLKHAAEHSKVPSQ